MSHRRRRSQGSITRLSLALASLFTASLAAHPQSSTSGAIAGLVADSTGHPVAGALVDILDPATGRDTRVTTSSTGSFLASPLPPAEYLIRISAPGVHLTGVDHVAVEVGGTSSFHATILPSTSSEITVNATSSVDTLEDPSSATSSVLDERDIEHLPTDGRSWQNFAQLTPQANPGSSSDETGLLSFRGLAPTQNSSRLDGADDDQSYNAAPHGSGTDAGPEAEDETESEAQSPSGNSGRNFSSGSGAGARPGAEYTFSEAAVREFRVVGQGYSALYGHAAGGVIATISKSGTDTLHGSAFYLIRQSAWAATNPFSIATNYNNGAPTSELVKPPDLRQQFGGTLGGPLFPRRYPHRFFFFYTFDAQRRSFPAVSSPENPAFYNLTPTQTALLGNRGVTAAKIAAGLSFLDSLTGVVPRRADQTVNFLKLDTQLSPRNRLSLQGNLSRFSSPSGIRSAPVVNRATRSFGNQNIRTDSILARWLYTRHANLSNELRVQGNRDLHSDQAQTPLPQEPAIAAGGLSPEIAIGPQGFYFGTPASIGKRSNPDEYRVQLADIGTLVHGRHLLQTGFDWSYVHDTTDSITNSAGSFHYDSGNTGGHAGGLVDWITDYTFNVNTYPNGGCPTINSPDT